MNNKKELLLNQMVQVIGILDWNQEEEKREDTEEEEDVFKGVPVIYVLSLKTIETQDLNLFYPNAMTSSVGRF